MAGEALAAAPPSDGCQLKTVPRARWASGGSGLGASGLGPEVDGAVRNVDTRAYKIRKVPPRLVPSWMESQLSLAQLRTDPSYYGEERLLVEINRALAEIDGWMAEGDLGAGSE